MKEVDPKKVNVLLISKADLLTYKQRYSYATDNSCPLLIASFPSLCQASLEEIF